MQGQETPPRHLRNVPAFRDLHIGSSTGWRSSLYRRSLNRDSSNDPYELLDTSNVFNDGLSNAHQTSPEQQHQYDGDRAPGHLDYTEPIVSQPDRLRPQSLVNDSTETILERPCQRTEILKEIWFPLLCIHGSMLAILGILTILLILYSVRPERGLFSDPTGWAYSRQKAYVLLKIPASTLSTSCTAKHH